MTKIRKTVVKVFSSLANTLTQEEQINSVDSKSEGKEYIDVKVRNKPT